MTLISGPVSIKQLTNVKTIHVQTAQEMLEATQNALPADIAVCAAAVSDWRPENLATDKIKKNENGIPDIKLTENPDILKTLSNHKNRPNIVVGFAAETNNLEQNAKKKIQSKKCDFILANDVSDEKVFGLNQNHVHFISHENIEDWGLSSKQDVAEKLVHKIIEYLSIEKEEKIYGTK